MAYFGRTGADFPVTGDGTALAFGETVRPTAEVIVLEDSRSSSARCKSERLESEGG